MKISNLFLLALLLTIFSTANAQQYNEEFTEVIKKEFNFDRVSASNVFVIENINGTIDVEGYNGNTVKVEVLKTIKANNKSNLELGKRDIKLGVFQKSNKICLYLDSPNTKFDEQDATLSCFDNARNGNYSNGASYHSELNYKVFIPKKTNVRLKNVSGEMVRAQNIESEMFEVGNVSGHIDIAQIKAETVIAHTVSGHLNAKNIRSEYLEAKTVSGHVNLNNISGQTDAKTVSGHINVSYDKNPKEASSYVTLSGNVQVAYQANLNADVEYDIKMSGDFDADFDYPENTNRTINSSPKKKSKKSKSSCSSTCTDSSKGRSVSAPFKIGKGGVDLYFETSSGNIYVSKS